MRKIFLRYTITADAETMLTALNDLLRQLTHVLSAEHRTTEVRIKIGNRQHDPVRICPPVHSVICNQCCHDILRNTIRHDGIDPRQQILREFYLRLTKRAKLQSIRDHIIEADDPRSLRIF